MSLRSWLWRDRETVVPLGDLAPLIPVDERGTGPSPCCAHHEQRIREVDDARATYFGQACDLAEKLADSEACIAELTAALDRDRPAPDREALAEDLRDSYWASYGIEVKTRGPVDESGWLSAADTAIDTCRGLRTTTERPSAARYARVDLTNARCDRPTPGTAGKPSQGAAAERGPSGADAPVTAGGESPGSGATSPDPAPGGLRWGTWAKAAGVLRSIALDIDTREPVGPMAAAYLRMMAEDLCTLHRPDQRPVIAAVLTAHELLEDDTCRCGWGRYRQSDDTFFADSVLYHAEHVAAQIVGTGAMAR